MNWVKIGTYGTIGIASVVGITVLYPYLLPILQNRNLWAAISVFSILLFCSGHMFNHIRGAPYMGGNGRGGVEYFAGGFQNQFGLESQIVGAMCMSSLSLLCCKRSWLTLHRWSPVTRDHCLGPQCAKDKGPEDTADCRVCLGRRHLCHVQLPAERLPHEERWISVLAAAILEVALNA